MKSSSEQSAVRLHHNLEKLSSSVKEYVTLMDLVAEAKNKQETVKQNGGSTTKWDDWLNENEPKLQSRLQDAGHAFNDLREVLGCGPCCTKPARKKPMKKQAKKSVGKATKRG